MRENIKRTNRFEYELTHCIPTAFNYITDRWTPHIRVEEVCLSRDNRINKKQSCFNSCQCYVIVFVNQDIQLADAVIAIANRTILPRNKADRGRKFRVWLVEYRFLPSSSFVNKERKICIYIFKLSHGILIMYICRIIFFKSFENKRKMHAMFERSHTFV